MVLAAAGTVCNIVGPLASVEHHLYTTAYLSNVADHIHPFVTTVYSSADG